MPTLTGTLKDVTGVELASAMIRQMFVKAPAHRPSLASGDALIVSAPVNLGASGTLSVDLEPGPAVLVVQTHNGAHDTYELHVTADMTLLSEAVAESSPDRSWVESVMVQLRADAVAAATAAGEDRVQTGLDRVATGQDREQTGLDRVATGEDRVATGEDRTQTGLDRVAAETARGEAVDAAGDVAAAVAQFDVDFAADMAQFAGIRDEMNVAATTVALDANRAEVAANSFGLSASSSTLAPGAAATVTVSGDGPAYSLAFGVPQGPKGDKGDEGEISQAQLAAAIADAIEQITGNAPETLDTIDEIAAALLDNPDVITELLEAVGKRALIDGAPAAYNTLGKLVAALQAGDLGGSTDAAELTGALTGQVDASAAMVDSLGTINPIGELFDTLGGLLVETMGNLEGKAESGHTHPVTDLTATGTRSSATYLRGDGTWATPTNTTYSVPTQAEAEAGTATTARAFSAQRVRQAADAAVSARVQLVASFPASPVSGVLYLKAE